MCFFGRVRVFFVEDSVFLVLLKRVFFGFVEESVFLVLLKRVFFWFC